MGKCCVASAEHPSRTCPGGLQEASPACPAPCSWGRGLEHSRPFLIPSGGRTRPELELGPWGGCWARTVPGASCRGASAVTKPQGLELSWQNGLRRERGRDAEAPVSPWKRSGRRARLLPRRGLELSPGGLLAAWFGLSQAQRQAALISGKRLAGFLQQISLSSLDRQLGNFKKSSQQMSHSVCKWEK